MKTIKKKVHFGRGKRSEKVLRQGEKPVAGGRVPRISVLMALAITFEELMRSGAVRTFAELAQQGRLAGADYAGDELAAVGSGDSGAAAVPARN